MPNFIDEYLLKLGAVVDQSGMARFQNALREATITVDKVSVAMAGKFFKAQTEIVGGFMAIGAAALGLADKVAVADQEYRLFALHMYMSKDAARSLKVAMDALGQPLENLSWDPELRARTRQLIADQKAMAPAGDFDEQMRKIRDIRFEFTRMEVEVQYLGMHVVQDFLKALGIGPDDLLKKLRQFNDWITKHLPEISAVLVRDFMPVWKDVVRVFQAVSGASEDIATAFTHVVGILSGDDALVKSTGNFDSFAQAVAKVADAMATVAATLANIVDLLAQVVDLVAKAAGGDFKGAAQNLKNVKKDLTGGTVGALLAGGAVAALSLGTGQVEGLAAEPEAMAAGAAAETAVEGEAAPWLATAGKGALGWFRRHWLLSMGGGALIGSHLAGEDDQGVTGGSLDDLMNAVRGTESGSLGMRALSPKGAIGTYQLMPQVAKSLGVNPYDAGGNKQGAYALMRQLLAHYGGDVAEALGGYNAGQPRMDAFLAGKATLPEETRNYIGSTLGRMGKSGDVNVGGIVIHITEPGASAEKIANTVAQRVAAATDKETQRNLQEFQQLSWSY